MKIAIAGYGVEGRASYRYWNTPENQVVIVDEKQPSADLPVDASVIVGEGAYRKLNGYDMVIRTPGLAPRKIVTDGKIWSATNEFFAKCPASIIGVTGSKGKGTTCSLIASILRAAGRTVHLVGNIGVPALDILADIQPDDIVVYELSSFQLWDCEKSPDVAVVLMIEPDHLDVHADMEDYLNAKANIRRHQGCDEVCIYHPTNQLSYEVASVPLETTDGAVYDDGEDTRMRYGVKDDHQVYVKESTFFIQDTTLCSVDALQLPGTHNIDNACAAISAAFAVERDISGEAVQRGLESFKGLEHRLKFVRELHGVAYYDDSIATTPGSSIAALHAFDVPKVLILGGSDKGADYSDLADEIMANDMMRAIIAVGEQGPVIAKLLNERGAGRAVNVKDSRSMKEIVEAAAACAQPGDVVILSPACASFDMFKSYADRGEQFIKAVGELI